MFGGGVEDTDPRRFIVETMLAAMEADGDITDEELATMEKNLEEHQLFAELSGEARTRLIDMGADAIREAGGGTKRLDAISKGLSGKTHRLTAYAMACEVCVSDSELPESEIRFLDSLQKALNLDDKSARELFEAARGESSLQTVEEKASAMREIMPRFVDCMAMMALADGEIHEEEISGVRAVLSNIPDMAVLTPDELGKAIDDSFGRLKGKELAKELEGAADAITQAVDRYWTTVYMMIIALADGTTDWREIAFLQQARDTFGLDDELMDHAMATASQFPAVQLGGSVPG
jgi:uncharacterized tellurite resistance protein B-like protein